MKRLTNSTAETPYLTGESREQLIRELRSVTGSVSVTRPLHVYLPDLFARIEKVPHATSRQRVDQMLKAVQTLLADVFNSQWEIADPNRVNVLFRCTSKPK
jgi:hypothetical protein